LSLDSDISVLDNRDLLVDPSGTFSLDLNVVVSPGGVGSSLILVDPSLVLDLLGVILPRSVESLLVLGDPSLVGNLLFVILPRSVESLLVLGDPSVVLDLLSVVSHLGFKSVLVFVDPLVLLLVLVDESHLSGWSVLGDPFSSTVSLSDESSRTLDHLVLSDPLVSGVGFPSAFVSPVGFVGLVRLLDVGPVVGGPSSVFVIKVRHVDAVLVWLPNKSVVNPNESVEPSALRSVLPDEDSRVVPVLTDCGTALVLVTI